MSFDPRRDGAKIWTYWHLMAANAITPKKREFVVNWVNSQKDVFPCEICRQHLVGNLEALPVEPYSNTNVSLFLHSWKIHDTVNKQLKKPESQRLSYEEAFAIYFPNTTGPGAGHPQTHSYLENQSQIASHSVQATGRLQRSPTSTTHSHQPAQTVSTQNVDQTSGFERHLVAGSNQTSTPRSETGPQQCHSCQQEPAEFTKTDYQEFRQQKRTVYLPKN
jgi:hypothetical protein